MLVIASATVGVASHALYFHHGEHHMHGISYINILLLSVIGLSVCLFQFAHVSFGAALWTTLCVFSSWALGVFVSLSVYRAFLNPLNRFPGAFMARMSGFWQATQYTKMDSYYQLTRMHQEKGDIVRLGPGDLSIAHPDIVGATFSNNSKITKAEWYDGDAPLISMHTSRDKGLHDKRRRIWAPAFSDKSLREYEPKIDSLSQKFVTRMEEFRGVPVNVSKWFNLYSFDVMGRLAFGKDYHMLDSGEVHYALQLLTEGIQPLAFRFPIWFFRIVTRVPGLAAGFQKFCRFCADELAWRVKNGGQGSDIMSSILKAYEKVANPEKDAYLQADSRLIIIAGSDTTAATFTYLFYHLAQHPEIVESLRAELNPLTAQGDAGKEGRWSDRDIRAAPLLNACITEALRLHPPVPSGVARRTPAEGLRLGDTFVPPFTTFWTPFYVIQRDERNFEDANSFVPERWTTKPHMVKNDDAWAPFTAGPFGCIGKNLALMELRTLTTRLVQQFDVKLAPGEDGRRLLHDTLDHFTVHLGSLDLLFSDWK